MGGMGNKTYFEGRQTAQVSCPSTSALVVWSWRVPVEVFWASSCARPPPQDGSSNTTQMRFLRCNSIAQQVATVCDHGLSLPRF